MVREPTPGEQHPSSEGEEAKMQKRKKILQHTALQKNIHFLSAVNMVLLEEEKNGATEKVRRGPATLCRIITAEF